MSFILDALKRSERARRVLGAAQSPPAAEQVGAPHRGWFIGVTLLLLANAVLLAWFVLRPSVPEAVVPRVAASGEVRSLAREAGGADSPVPLVVASPPTPIAAPVVATVTLDELEPALRARAESLHVDVHGWADDPAQRFVIINLKRHVIGDPLEGGVTVVDIVADGVVIEIEGRRVLLPRQ